MPVTRIAGLFLLVVGLFIADSSLVFGQPAAPADEAAANNNAPDDKPAANKNKDALTEYKPLMTPEEAVNFRKTKLRDFDELLRGGKLNGEADKKLIAEGARYHLYLMTLKQDPISLKIPLIWKSFVRISYVTSSSQDVFPEIIRHVSFTWRN